jgi:nucleotide-binding universal stress UspA family protein
MEGMSAMHMQTILHPTDFAEPSQAALRFAVALARDYGARLVILHAVETMGPENVTYGEAVSRPQPEAYRQRLWEDVREVRPADALVPLEYVLAEGDPATAIIQMATERRCDLIVLGSHGRRGWRRLLEGSVAEQVVRRAPCPVLVVRSTMEPQLVPPREKPDCLAAAGSR